MTSDTDQPATVEAPMSWDAFTRRLADSLGRLAVESFLVLSLPSDDAGARAFVQFAHRGGDDGASSTLRAEAAASADLPGTRPLTPVQEERIRALEWQRPAAEDAGRNFTREWSMPAPFAEVAAVATRTLRDVYGVVDPAELRYRYASFEGLEVEDLDLGIEPVPQSPRPRSKLLRRQSTGQLTPLVEDGLRRWLGVDRLERDADGDYPIPVGSALVFVRVASGRMPMIAISSSILTDVEESPRLYAALNDVNRRIRFARAFWVARTIVIATELPAVDVTADQIAFACLQLGNLADRLDDLLHGPFGGGVAFEGGSLLVH